MKVAIATYVAQDSSKELAEALREVGIEALAIHPDEYYRCDHVFNYGCSLMRRYAAKVVNVETAVARCIDKVETFKAFDKAKVPTVEWRTTKRIPKRWQHVVIRKTRTGRKAEGYDVVPNNGNLPDGKLFTEYFYHKREYRIVVFNGEVVGRYLKKEVDGMHEFVVQRARGFEAIDNAARKASKALGIDYVGFDVVCNTKQDFRFLEANSAPMLMPEAKKAIINYFLKLKA